jgi:hypothetical protein
MMIDLAFFYFYFLFLFFWRWTGQGVATIGERARDTGAGD